MITTVCKLSYSSRTVPPIVQAVQGDTGRTVRFDVTDFTIPAGAEATYFIEKPSGEAVYNAATISGNSILCELTAQSLAEPGENKMQVRVILNDEIVTSFKVCLLVSTFWGIDAIESSTEMNIFDKAVEQATEDFQTNAEQIVEEVIESIPSDYTALTEEVDELNERLDNLQPGLSNEAKEALLACFENVAWKTGDGLEYYDALELALNGGKRITAVYNQGENPIYTTDNIDSIKEYLTVIYTDENGNSQEVTDYTLATEMEQGQSECTVSYNDLKTTFVATITPVTISYSDIVQGGVSYSYPYHNSNANRVGYYGTDKIIVPGKRYKIEYDDNSSGGTVDVGIKRYLTVAYNTAVNQGRLVAEWEQATPHWDKSGIEFRGQQDQKMCFFTFRDSTGNITPSMISNVRLTCIAGNIPIVPWNNDY